MYEIPTELLLTTATGSVRYPNRSEPGLGSVVLTNGATGTAFQRQGDGLWYRAGGKYMPRGITWDRLLRYRLVVLVYAAPVR